MIGPKEAFLSSRSGKFRIKLDEKPTKGRDEGSSVYKVDPEWRRDKEELVSHWR